MSEDTALPADQSASQLQVEIIETPMGDSDGQSITAKIPDIGFLPLQDFMGIDHPDGEQKDKLDFVWKYFNNGRDRVDTLQAIKEAKNSLSQPDIGQTHLHKLYAYTRLLDQSRAIEREKRVYQHDGNNSTVDGTPKKV